MDKQTQAVNRAFQLLHNRGFEKEARELMEAVESIKASGAEHLGKLVRVLVEISKCLETGSSARYHQMIAERALSKLPPELRGEA